MKSVNSISKLSLYFKCGEFVLVSISNAEQNIFPPSKLNFWGFWIVWSFHIFKNYTSPPPLETKCHDIGPVKSSFVLVLSFSDDSIRLYFWQIQVWSRSFDRIWEWWRLLKRISFPVFSKEGCICIELILVNFVFSGCVWETCRHDLRQDVGESGRGPGPQREQGNQTDGHGPAKQRQLQLLVQLGATVSAETSADTSMYCAQY